MRGKVSILLVLLAAFVFAYSLGLHSSLKAGDDQGLGLCQHLPDDLGHCCKNDDTERLGICVDSSGHAACMCDCIFVPWTTCNGPLNCQYDLCAEGIE